MENKITSPNTTGTRKNIIKIAVLILFIGVVLVVQQSGYSQYFNQNKIRQTVSDFGAWGPGIFIALYIVGSLLFFPGTPFTLAAGLLFGPYRGTGIAVIGATMGATLAFLLSRYIGRDFVTDTLHARFPKLSGYNEKIQEHGFLTVVFLRLIPLFPYNGLNFALGLTKVKTTTYLFATALGIIPGTFIIANIGATLDNVMSLRFFLFIGLFILLMFLPKLYSHIKKRKGQQKQ